MLETILCSIWKEGRNTCLEVVVVVLWKGLIGCLSEFRFVLVLEGFVKGELGGLQGGRIDKVKGVVPGQLACQPQKGLFKVVVGFGGNVVVLQVLFAVEGDLLRLDLTILDLDLVSSEDDGDIFTNTSQVTMPIGDVLVGDTGRHVKHDNRTLALYVVSVAESTKFLWWAEQDSPNKDGSKRKT